MKKSSIKNKLLAAKNPSMAANIPSAIKEGEPIYIVAVPAGGEGPVLLEKRLRSVTRRPCGADGMTSCAVIVSGPDADLTITGPAYMLRQNSWSILGVYGAGADVMKYGWKLGPGSYAFRKKTDADSAYKDAKDEFESAARLMEYGERNSRADENKRLAESVVMMFFLIRRGLMS